MLVTFIQIYQWLLVDQCFFLGFWKWQKILVHPCILRRGFEKNSSTTGSWLSCETRFCWSGTVTEQFCRCPLVPIGIRCVSSSDALMFDIYNWQHFWLSFVRHQVICSRGDLSDHEWFISIAHVTYGSAIPPTLDRGSLSWCKLILAPVWMGQILP